MEQRTIAHSLFTDFDISLFKAGKHYNLFDLLGAHPMTLNGVQGTYFAVWAPSAKKVSVIGDFNYWLESDHALNVRWDGSGIWEGFLPGVGHGNLYKYKIHSHHNGEVTEKADPFARFCEQPPKTASIVWEEAYTWKDKTWLTKRKKINQLDQAFSVYEVHLSSWKKKPDGTSLTYEELARELVSYVKEMGYTHVEFMPIMEYPYDPSWGYQLTGYFAPSSRFGNPTAFKGLIEAFHKEGIAVLLDWVPSHFPSDDHGLGNFDGSHLYEHPDPRKGYHKDWKSLIFNYELPEVRAFLISNAVFWMQEYHIDGLRVDAVASMLYLDYSREEGEWEPNEFGGRENLAAQGFLKDMNLELYSRFEGIQTIAEESTAFPMVSRPTDIGGLGFGMKWMMGWMHDTLTYMKKDSVYRKYHHNEISFSLTYAFTENFMLPLSHDEVVYGKKSILGRMPGDEWQRFANLRTLYTYMFTHPGAKLNFMGGDFGQHDEWNFEKSLDWHLTQYTYHKGIQELVKDLNKLYKSAKALHQLQFSSEGFEWLSYDDSENSILSYIRKGKSKKDRFVILCNFTPTPHQAYQIGVPEGNSLSLVFNSDASKYGGSDFKINNEYLISENYSHGKNQSVILRIPPLSTQVYKIL